MAFVFDDEILGSTSWYWWP